MSSGRKVHQSLVIVGALCVFAGTVAAQTTAIPPAPDYGAAGAGGMAPSAGSTHFAWADVLRVDPVYESVSVARPQRQCRDVRVTGQTRGNGAAGAVIGAIVGGVLGNTVGKGDGRQAATVVGAVAGGAIGHGVATGNDATHSEVQTRCHTVPQVSRERRISGYDVEYRYQGDIYMSRMAYDPGERLRVRVSVTPVN